MKATQQKELEDSAPQEKSADGGESFGLWLRRQREGRGIELREIADASKISIRYLQAFEDERFDILPDGGIFVKGFLRQYARYVGLDAEEVVNFYMDTCGEDPEDTEAEDSRPPNPSSGRLLWLAAAVALAMLAAFWWLSKEGDGAGGVDVTAAGQETPGTVDGPTADPPTPDPSTADSPAADSPAADSPTTNTSTGDASADALSTDSTPVDGTSTDDGATLDRQTGDRQTSLADAAPTDGTAPSGNAPSEPVATSRGVEAGPDADAPLRVVLEFSAQCWVESAVDGGRRSGELKNQGEALFLNGREVVELKVGNVDAVRIEVNGYPFPLEATGSTSVRSVRIDRDTLRQLTQGLS